MDDDQFQGNLSVQGGNPEPIDGATPQEDTGASTFVLGEAEKTASEADAAGVVEANNEATKEPEEQSEMSRRMDEILGSFDDGIATAGAISSGKGKIIQGTAVRADAPKPDFAKGPAAAPVQDEVTVATEGVYDTNAATTNAMPEVQQPTDIPQTPEAPVTPEPTVVQAPVEPVAATPSLTGVPRSNIEQAAAEQAARDAVEAEKNKKIDPKILLGMIICILIIIGSGVVIFMKLTAPKGPKVEPDTVHGEPEPEPNVDEDTTQRIGTPEHGYVDIPSDWERLVEGVEEGEFAYADEDNKNRVVLSSVAMDGVTDARAYANGQYSAATAAGYSLPQMSEIKVSTYDAFEVYYYSKDAEQWTFKYIFSAEDNRIHVIQVIVTDNTSPLVNTVPESWSLNQNKTEKEDVEEVPGSDEPEDETETEDTEGTTETVDDSTVDDESESETDSEDEEAEE